MPRELEPSTIEADFTLSAIRKGLRLDKRELTDYRSLALNFNSHEFGFCECQLGSTRVAAQVSAEIVKPQPERPYEGFLLVNAEISPMASSVYESGRPSEEETIIARLLEKALRRSGAVDQESLCIVAGQKVWSIRVDLHFLDDEGNLVDCACIAAMAALLHFRRPDVSVSGEEVTVHSLEERVPIPLSIHHSPFCITFAFLGEENFAVLDPSHLESQLASGTLTMTLNAQREICVLTKAGGSPMSVDEIMRCVNLASKKVKEIDALLKEALQKDAVRRKVHEGDSGLGEMLLQKRQA